MRLFVEKALEYQVYSLFLIREINLVQMKYWINTKGNDKLIAIDLDQSTVSFFVILHHFL